MENHDYYSKKQYLQSLTVALHGHRPSVISPCGVSQPHCRSPIQMVLTTHQHRDACYAADHLALALAYTLILGIPTAWHSV